MNKLLKLLKIDMLQSFSLNKLNRKHNKKNYKQIGSLILIGVSGLFLFFASMFYMFMMGYALKSINHIEAILYIGISCGSVFCFMYSFFKSSGFLYETKDFELLMALPIKTKYIVTSKLLSLLLINYLLFGLFYIPSIVAYIVLTTVNALVIIQGIIVFMTGPLLIMSVCGFVSFVINVLLRKFKYKNYVMSILYFVLFIALFVLYMMFVNKIGGNDDVDINEMANMILNIALKMKNVYPMSGFVVKGFEGNILYFLLFVAIMIIPFVILVIFVSKTFLVCNMNAKSIAYKSTYKLSNSKTPNKIKALLKKETKRFFSSTNIMLNLGIGPIMSTLLVVMNVMMNSYGSTEEMKSVSTILIIMLSGLAFGMMPSTSSSINLEGKTFWILKSTPVKTKDVFIAKSLFYVLLCLPFAIINTGLYVFINGFNALNTILMLVDQVVIIIIFAFEGLFINILAPKLDWDNEVRAIKQTGAPVISMLFGFLIDGLLFIIPFILEIYFGFGLIGVLVMGILILTIVSILLFTVGKSKYERIQV